MYGDFGTFGLLWILLNLFFMLALIGGGMILVKWLGKRKRMQQKRRKNAQPNLSDQEQSFNAQ